MAFIRFVGVQLLVLLVLTGCSSFGRQSDALRPSAVTTTRSVVNDEYRLGAGDIITIRVYGGDEDVRLERIRLDNSGTVSLPFGEFKAGGRTARELETAITQNVQGRLLKNPRVWVNVEEHRPFFVEGQVGRPGAYPYQPGLNVRKAVTIAGGFRERASPQKIFIVRDRDASNARVKTDLNAPVGPGDTLIVEESFF